MENTRYFDLHMHPAFKRFITKFDDSYPSNRRIEDIVGEIDLKNPVTDLLEEEFLQILESQCCFEQLKTGKVQLGVAAIASIERTFSARDGLFGKVLNSGFFTSPLDQSYMRKIRNGDISYYQLFIKELELYKRMRDMGKLNLLNRKRKGNFQQDHVPALALGMEGAHSLIRTKIGQPNIMDTVTGSGNADSIYKDFKQSGALPPAESLRSLMHALWDEGMDLLYLTLTHLSHIPEQYLATHAYGMKMLKEQSIYPVGNGLSPKGKQVIDAAYTMQVKPDAKAKKTVPAPVLIDIKHMSLKSRLDLYAYRKEKGYEHPLLASHMGVTGYSIEEWKNELKAAEVFHKAPSRPVEIIVNRRKAGEWGALNKSFSFNSWTINLMDEDIVEVLNSNGLIGISLDARILGWQDAKSRGDKSEFLSLEDFRYFFPNKYTQLRFAPEAIEQEETYILPTKEERHPLALCFNILHVVSVGKTQTTQDPWEMICIGSDFDGLIYPVINCRNAGRMPALEQAILRWLPVAEQAYLQQNGGPQLLQKTNAGTVDEAKLKENVQRLMYKNGERFLYNWLQGSLPPKASGHSNS